MVLDPSKTLLVLPTPVYQPILHMEKPKLETVRNLAEVSSKSNCTEDGNLFWGAGSETRESVHVLLK